MAAAVATFTQAVTAPAKAHDNTQTIDHIFGTIAVSASPATYTAGGIALTLAGFDGIKSGYAPFRSRIDSQVAAGSGATALYVYHFLPGTTLANGKLQIFTGAAAQSGLTELTDGASIPAGVSGDSIVAEFLFARL